MSPPTITITPSRNATNVGPDVSRVALVRACTLAPASEPAMARASTIGANRPTSMTRPSATSYQGVLADSPAKADRLGEADRRSLDRLRELAADVGARWHEIQGDDPARAIASFARQHQITQIVIGSSQRNRWKQFTGGGSNVQRVIREAGAFGIDVHVIARREMPPAEAFDVIAASQP